MTVAELIVTGRIATLGGSAGFGWVEAIAIGGGRVVASGDLAEVEAASGPGTRRLSLSPDEVALPGLTDAHLHLAEAAMAARAVDLEVAPTLAVGLDRIGSAHVALADPEAWIVGHGWDLDRWGRWPTAADLETVAPGRRIALWAHDHHSLLASRAALLTAEIGSATTDPEGGQIRRAPDGASPAQHEKPQRRPRPARPFRPS